MKKLLNKLKKLHYSDYGYTIWFFTTIFIFIIMMIVSNVWLTIPLTISMWICLQLTFDRDMKLLENKEIPNKKEKIITQWSYISKYDHLNYRVGIFLNKSDKTYHICDLNRYEIFTQKFHNVEDCKKFINSQTHGEVIEITEYNYL